MRWPLTEKEMSLIRWPRVTEKESDKTLRHNQTNLEEYYTITYCRPVRRPRGIQRKGFTARTFILAMELKNHFN